jgi:hypothetical protein
LGLILLRVISTEGVKHLKSLLQPEFIPLWPLIMDPALLLQLLCVISFILIHLFSGYLTFLDVLPRSRWLSFAGGTSVAYVFLHVFPELDHVQVQIQKGFHPLQFLEHHAYILALAGLSFFYGLERLMLAEQRKKYSSVSSSPSVQNGVYWLHLGSFSLYNLLVGYLLVHRQDEEPRHLLLYVLAMGMHFVVNDYGLRQDHQEAYHRIARWCLSISVGVGWVLGRLLQLPQEVVGLLFAVLAGAVILNVLKEELPENRESRFFPFLAGVVLFSLLLLVG